MSALDEIRAAATLVAPQLRAPWLAACALLTATLLALGGWWFFVRPHQAQVKAAAARVEAATASATAGAAQSTLHIVTDNARTIAAIDALNQENARAIQSAKGMDDAVDPAVDAAGRNALCLRSAYRADPVCIALRGNGRSIGASATDTGNTIASE